MCYKVYVMHSNVCCRGDMKKPGLVMVLHLHKMAVSDRAGHIWNINSRQGSTQEHWSRRSKAGRGEIINLVYFGLHFTSLCM